MRYNSDVHFDCTHGSGSQKSYQGAKFTPTMNSDLSGTGKAFQQFSSVLLKS